MGTRASEFQSSEELPGKTRVKFHHQFHFTSTFKCFIYYFKIYFLHLVLLKMISFKKIFKVTVYLQGCLARKRCSACSLSCRYVNPYIKLKLMELAIKLYQEFWKKMNCRIFHDHYMRAPESPFESYKSKRISFFANLIFSSVSGPKALIKRVCVLAYSIAVKSYRTFSK